MSAAARVEVLGIRHHGPGSARAVLAALDDLQPQAVLIEGPADADPLVLLAATDAMRPPVALLAYAVDEPSRAAFWPFAEFSPEWQAIRWAQQHQVPVRFCDLPASAVLARPASEPAAPDGAATSALRHDPIAELAAAAGYDDPERWWDDVVESRPDGPAPFTAITEAMQELRESAAPSDDVSDQHEQRREAHMRTVLRSVLRQRPDRVAVVCGAWHAPALSGKLPSAAADAAVLKGMARRKASLTWVPWTHSRLATASGYGAGVDSPGWYHHLFTRSDRPVTRWLVRVAAVLREEDLPVSSAHVIEAVRLAEALAGMRGRQLAGLAEVSEATRSVLCDGDDVLLALVTERLVVGEELGAVPADTPTVPLQADLEVQGRRLRLRLEALERRLDLDLRKDTDRGRSHLLHRLRLLGIAWGNPASAAVRSTGTFRETWTLVWRPELAVAVVEAAMWGTTVQAAATARVRHVAAHQARLADLTAALESTLNADLPDALPALLRAIDDRAAQDLDVAHLMAAVPPMVRAWRYGDVRGTDTAALAHVVDALLVRISAGLPAALTSLDDDGAAVLRRALDDVHDAVVLREDERARERWLATLGALAERRDVHGLLVGRAVRVLRDVGALSSEAAGTRLGRALSTGATAADKAAWMDGFLAGGGLLLVHDDALLAILDRWVSGLSQQEFVDVLPLVRRTFGDFAAPERRSIGDRVRRRAASSPADPAADQGPFDPERGRAAMATVATIMGARP